MSESHTITVKIFSLLQMKLGIRQVLYSSQLSAHSDTHEDPAVRSAAASPTVLELLDWLQEIADDKNLEIQITHELLEDDGSIRPGTLLLINGKNVIHAEGVHTKVEYGSILSIFPPSGGG